MQARRDAFAEVQGKCIGIFPTVQTGGSRIAANSVNLFYCGTPITMFKHYSSEGRLELLRKNDPHRKWYSLDDKRVCVLCDRVLTGRQVEITHGRRGATLRCPTDGCESTPNDWFYHASASSAARLAKPSATAEFAFL